MPCHTTTIHLEPPGGIASSLELDAVVATVSFMLPHGSGRLPEGLEKPIDEGWASELLPG
jgi:hypothetical protein